MIVDLDLPSSPTRTLETPAATTDLLTAALIRGGDSRKLSELLTNADLSFAYLSNRAALRAAADQGDDPVLYRAYRNVLPPRHIPDHDRVSMMPRTRAWFADLVAYSGSVLPGGHEPCRSLGHWNTPTQLEIFHCLAGRILMLYTNIDDDGAATVDYQVCVAGDHVIVPFGAWHLTVAFDGPAVVFNVYTDADIPCEGHTSRGTATHAEVKYRAAPAPKLAVFATEFGLSLTGEPAELAARTVRRRNASPRWARGLLEPNGLTAQYRYAPDAQLARLYENALQNDQLAPRRTPVRIGQPQ